MRGTFNDFGDGGWLVHVLASDVGLDPEATALSVDGVGAFDNVSRRAMLEALRAVPGANRCLPFVLRLCV